MSSLEIAASLFFAIAVVHTFAIKHFQQLAARYPQGSIKENLFHLLGEVEIVFGLWAGTFVLTAVFLAGSTEAFRYVESLNFTEPAFVFVIMAIASTRPILNLAEWMISTVARKLPLPPTMAFLLTALTVGPLLGSLITEPAAMTVTALLLKPMLFDRSVPQRVKYAAIAVLFVNISIGGVLTHFAAPPVLMVASLWNWDSAFMIQHFGWKALIAVFLNATLFFLLFRKDLPEGDLPPKVRDTTSPPAWLTFAHLTFLATVVFTAHHPLIFLGIFLFFLGFATITAVYQSEIKLKESLLVAFFLGGLVVLGGLQNWWLKPILESLGAPSLFGGATLLTAVVDNAALTYLGTQVSGFSDLQKFGLVAGAVCGGGLSVIANAPNPAGFSILQKSFGNEGISPVKLFAYAIVPTLIAMSCLWFLPY